MEDDKIKLLNRCQFLTTIIGIIVIFVSVLVCIGTISRSTVLTSVSPFWVNIKINTAVCFLLAGFALLLLNKNRKFFNFIAFALAILILLISGATLFEYISGVDLRIDELLLTDIRPLTPGTFSPGRMSLVTAINFILVGFTFLFSRKPVWIAQTLVFFILLLSLVSFFNYLYGADNNYDYAKYTTMSAYTIVLYFLLCAGILFKNPDSGIVGILLGKNDTGYLLRRTILIPIIVPIFLFQLAILLEKKGFIDSFSAMALVQVGIYSIVGLMIVLISIILNRKEKNLTETQLQLQQNEIIFRQFAENIDIVFYTTSPDLSKILYVSPAYEKIWGESAESLYKNPKAWFDAILPGDQKNAYENIFSGLKKEKVNISAEYRIKRPDGSIRNIFARVYELKDENNTIFAIAGIAVDMTQIKKEKIYKQLLRDILYLIETEKNITSFFHKALKMISGSLDLDFSELWLLDKTQKVLRCVDTWHKDSDLLRNFDTKSRQHVFNIGEGFPGKVWETQQPFWISDYSDNPSYSRSNDAKTAGLNSAFGIPIIYQNKIFGIIEFFSHDIRKPDAELLTVMEQIGKSIGIFIERKNTAEEIQTISQHDFLTGLLNRTALEKNLDDLIANKKSQSIAVMMLDIDRFKLVNEALGHEQGDILLKSVASRLSELNALKETNLARIGADKFVFYFPETNKKDALNYAHAMNHLFDASFDIGNNQTRLSITIGIAIYPEDGLDSQSLVTHADLAMAQAKDQGGNRINFFTEELPFIASKAMTLDAELRAAIAGNQFVMQYQPQINLKTGRICAAEALVRWLHPVRGLTRPDEFISFAEKTGLIVSLNEHLMRTVFQEIHANSSTLPISINISAQQFQDGFQLVNYLESLMKEFNVSAEQIELEITENTLLKDTEHNIAVLTALHGLGFKIAIDDFGTGFSSLSYIKRLQTHKIKIDKSFITGLPQNTDNANIVRAIIAMTHSLQKIVVAEGAETKAEVDFLIQENCDIVQGFYYYKPMSFEDLITAVAKTNLVESP